MHSVNCKTDRKLRGSKPANGQKPFQREWILHFRLIGSLRLGKGSMKSSLPAGRRRAVAFRNAPKWMAIGFVIALAAQALGAKPEPRDPQGIVSDWTHHHVLYPKANDESAKSGVEVEPRWTHSWYLRHRETWWPGPRRRHQPLDDDSRRDWNIPLAATPSPYGFEPAFNYTFKIGPTLPHLVADAGFGTLNATNLGNGTFLATGGTLTVTTGNDVGSYTLYPGGPANTISPSGFFSYNNVLYPGVNPALDMQGLLFAGAVPEINIWGNAANNYTFYDNSGYTDNGTTFTLTVAPGGGQVTFPAKYVFDVTTAPNCARDFVAFGIPATPAAGGQANLIGLNNLYSFQGTPVPTPAPLCATNGPTVKFAYASGSGQVPGSVALNQTGTQIAYIENVVAGTAGSSYFHVLTIGTTGTNGTSAAAAVVPGAGNNAVDRRVLLSPNGGTTNQNSTNSVFIVYTVGDANDAAYVTTTTTANNGTGYLYKLGNVFNGNTPTITWSLALNAIPSSPVYDSVSNKIFFTDSRGRIDYVIDTGAAPAVVYSAILANGNTATYPVVIDSTNQKVYASFNTNGANAVIVQAPTTMASSVSVPVGSPSPSFTGPYEPDFNNAWYTGTGTPLMYVAGTGTGSLPTLYSVGFNGSGVMNNAVTSTTALTTGAADSSPVTEFYNPLLLKDYMFVGVSDHCIATVGGGTAGCVMSLDVTAGFPTVNANTTALPAGGGTSGIVVDNDSSSSEASSIYYATKTGQTLVKATQTGLN